MDGINHLVISDCATVRSVNVLKKDIIKAGYMLHV